jgi:modulator of FtsH protease
MSIYDRNYLGSGGDFSSSASSETFSGRDESRSALMGFVKQTYQLFAGSLLAATVGAYLGMGIAPTIASWYWGLVILEFALLFGIYAVKDKPGINLAVLFAFTFITGLTITPLLSTILAMPGGASIVANAFLLTTAIFGAMSLFALTTTKDLANMGKTLFIALIVVIIGSVINIFLGNPILQTLIAGAGAIIFSLFIAYDTQNIIKGAYSSPVEAAISLYLSFFNLFVSLLQLLGIFGSNDE